MTFKFPSPDPQVNFALKLVDARTEILQDALKSTVAQLDVTELDKQLAQFAPKAGLSNLAGHGLRGELVFPVPLVLEANPRLLAYYRLLLGYSQKVFYTSATGMGRFKAMEEKGILTEKNRTDLGDMCSEMGAVGALLLAGVGTSAVSDGFLDDLTLLTLGPQFRGGANNEIGAEGITVAFGIIREIVHESIIEEEPSKLRIKNAAGRSVLIVLAADPDIILQEVMQSGQLRHLVAIEVKGGRDFSNIHNRVGEAEKSHQKAKGDGFTECWTIVNVDNFDFKQGKRESPATDRFYVMADLIDEKSQAYGDFRDRIQAVAGTT